MRSDALRATVVSILLATPVLAATSAPEGAVTNVAPPVLAMPLARTAYFVG